MVYLHFCGGDRGGVGKTLFAKTLISYYEEIDKPVTVFDTDRANQDLYKLKDSVNSSKLKLERTIFSDNPEYEDEPDKILYEVLDGRDVIVNLPAGSTLNVSHWWKRCGATELCKENEVEATHWFLTGGDNFHLINNSLSRFPLFHVFVKNEYLRSDWEIFDDRLSNLLNGTDAGQLMLLRLGRQLADYLSIEGMLLHHCLEHKSIRILEKQKLKYFIKEMSKRISSTQRVPPGSEATGG